MEAFQAESGLVHGIVTVSTVMLRALALAERFAKSNLPILVLGATGTGKELFARGIHQWSGRSGRFLDINCGALPTDLIEGELFGHARGAYTSATLDHPGLLSAASRGTLFLDELTSLPARAQVKLLRVLETGLVRRLGEAIDRPVDLRVVAAAHPGIGADLTNGTFRLDLYERLAGLVLYLPALSERREEVIPIARHFAQLRGVRLTADAEAFLLQHSWPGNVRELRNVIERAAILGSSTELDRSALAEAVALGMIPAASARASLEGSKLSAKLGETDLETLCSTYSWHALPIANALGVSRATLFRMLRARGLSLRHKENG
jgi:transcriptional regulator with PAS, ATPase and Fis domain